MISLKNVYDKECLIFMNNISTLFSLPKISLKSASSLRNLIDTVSALYGSLLSIGDDTKILNAMLIYLVMNRVDPVTKQKWEADLRYERLPLWSDFEKMLNHRYQHLSAGNRRNQSQIKLRRACHIIVVHFLVLRPTVSPRKIVAIATRNTIS